MLEEVTFEKGAERFTESWSSPDRNDQTGGDIRQPISLRANLPVHQPGARATDHWSLFTAHYLRLTSRAKRASPIRPFAHSPILPFIPSFLHSQRTQPHQLNLINNVRRLLRHRKPARSLHCLHPIRISRLDPRDRVEMTIRPEFEAFREKHTPAIR